MWAAQNTYHIYLHIVECQLSEGLSLHPLHPPPRSYPDPLLFWLVHIVKCTDCISLQCPFDCHKMIRMVIFPPGLESTDELFTWLISWFMYHFLFLVKESDSDKQNEPGADCAEQDIGCWSLKWSARYERKLISILFTSIGSLLGLLSDCHTVSITVHVGF